MQTLLGNPSGNYFALLVAVQEYKSVKISNLLTPLCDVNELGKILKSHYNFSRIHIISDKDATLSNVLLNLRKTTTNLTENDSLLIYYAGHGGEDTELGGGWWLPYDADLESPATFLDNALVHKYIKATRAKHVC